MLSAVNGILGSRISTLRHRGSFDRSQPQAPRLADIQAYPTRGHRNPWGTYVDGVAAQSGQLHRTALPLSVLAEINPGYSARSRACERASVLQAVSWSCGAACRRDSPKLSELFPVKSIFSMLRAVVTVGEGYITRRLLREGWKLSHSQRTRESGNMRGPVWLDAKLFCSRVGFIA
jgi:hypothetical protein